MSTDELTVPWIAGLFIDRFGKEARLWAMRSADLHSRCGDLQAAAEWRRPSGGGRVAAGEAGDRPSPGGQATRAGADAMMDAACMVGKIDKCQDKVGLERFHGRYRGDASLLPRRGAAASRTASEPPGSVACRDRSGSDRRPG